MKDYEKNKVELEAIINKLEAGELSLEDSLSQFKRGIELYQDLETMLSQAEKEVQVIVDGKAKKFEEESDI